VFFRLDESNCSKIQGSANLSAYSVLKECYFDDYDVKFDITFSESLKDSNITEKHGFKCGEYHCLPIEYFCDQGWNTTTDFPAEQICPGFHFLNLN
jgi:hypothetical protein